MIGVLALVLFLVGTLVVVGALTISIQVAGRSMHPTLADGDRLVWNPLSRHDVKRFDLVEATTPDINSRHVVKRVIGLPGDRIAVPRVSGSPEVLVRPARSSTTYVIRSSTWDGQVGEASDACCADDGTSSDSQHWATVPEGSYWLLGDNWGGSTDSRTYGFVDTAHLGGTLDFRILPLGRFGRVHNPATMTPR
ncbi:MAG: signal peptidase I [Nocardioides sp.]|uniref:signal peptidase I n=1 Tax=Nocardioides sp. TaxID=35761 RepID=UPI0039E3198D